MKIVAHRGARGHEPENTIAAFKKALDIGVDAIELDVCLVATGEIVVIHDTVVNRTTNGTGYVADFNFEDLRKLDAGKGQQIPTLSEVIELVNRRVPIFIELKAAGTALPVADLLKEYLAKGWQPEDFEVISFDHPEVVAFRDNCPGIRIGLSYGSIPIDYCQDARTVGADSVMLCTELLSPAFIKDARDSDITVNSYTGEDFNADTQSEIERIQAAGVDSFASDTPDRAFAFLR